MNLNKASAKGVTGTGTVYSTPATLTGVSVRDTSGSTNTVKIFDNTSASGVILFAVQLAANASTFMVTDRGVDARIGLHLTSTAGIEGSVWVA